MLVKITIKYGRLNWCQSTEYYLITGPTKFWNTVFFLKYIHFLYYSAWCQRDLCSETCKGIRSGGDYHYGLLFSDFLQLPPTSKLDILKAIKCLWDSRSVVINVILGFTIKDGSTIFALLPEYNYDLSLSQQHFSTQWIKVVIVAIWKKRNRSPTSKWRPISLLNSFSEVFDLLYMVTEHYFKNKLNPIHHGLLKNKSRITNFVTYLDFISSLGSSQH